MKVSEILSQIKVAKGTNEKKRLLEVHAHDPLLRGALKFGLDPFTPFNVVKVPKVKEYSILIDELESWRGFFDILTSLSLRTVTGNAAIDLVHNHFRKVGKENEMWMRKILKKHLAIGVSIKSVNKVWPGFIKTFDVALAQKFDMNRIKSKEVYIEPKLDGIRCLAIVRSGEATLYTRAGKVITNFDDTIGKELSLFEDGCYDGEIMSTDFTELMRQVYRKEDKDISEVYFALFDYIPLDEWDSKQAKMPASQRYKTLAYCVASKVSNHLTLVERKLINSDYETIKAMHDMYVAQEYEGAMIKDTDAPYCFGRDWSVMKFKDFFDADVKIINMLEGTGKHAGKLGSFVVDYKGTEVRVGSGLTDAIREQLWIDPESHIGRLIEVRYQEETPDGSLRFPTFVCFRNDR